jgi:hypothetical protein
MSRMTQEELRDVEEQIELIQQQFQKVGDAVNGRVPARIIDKWLDIHRRLRWLRADGISEMRR